MATGRTLVLMACSLALVQLVALCQGQKPGLCSGMKVELRTLKDLEWISADKCDGSAKKAFEDLQKLVFEGKNICSMEKATAITQYFETHLKNGNINSIPREVIRFAIAYGMKVNSQCKWYMTGEFYELVDRTVYENEYDAIKQWTSDEGPIARLLSPLIKQGEFMVPSGFDIILPKQEREALLGLDSVDEDKMIRVKDLCKNRFRKFYDEMLLPIAHLDRNGFNYKSPGLDKHLTLSSEVRKHNILWSRIVFLCETVKDMGDFKPEEMGPSQVEHFEEFHPYLKIKDPIVEDSLLSSLKHAVDSYDLDDTEMSRFRDRIWNALTASGQSNESMAFLVKRAFKDEKDGEQDEQLKETKKELLSLLDPANRDKFVKVISKMSTGGKKAGRRIASALETSVLRTMGVLGTSPKVVHGDLHALKRDFTAKRRDSKKSDMRNYAFEDA